MPGGDTIKSEVHRFMTLKRLFVVGAGISVVLSAALLLTWVTVGVDVAFLLPTTVRWTALAIVLLGGIWGLLRFTIIPAWHVRQRSAIADIEHGRPELGQRVRTAAQMSDLDALPPGVSRELASALLVDAEERIQEADPAGLIPWRRMLAGIACFAASLGLVAVCLLTWPDFRIGSTRFLRPGAGLTFTTVEAACTAELPALGTAVEITGSVAGRPVEEVIFHLRQNEGDWSTIFMEPLEDGTFATSWTGQEVGVCKWFVTAGDGRTPVETFKVVIYPKVEAVSATLRYPGHLGFPNSEVRSGALEAVEGTVAALVFTMNHPVATARVILGDGRSLSGRIDGERVCAEVPVTIGETSYRLVGTDAEGLPIRPNEFSMRGTPDRLPKVKIQAPPETSEVTKITEVPLRVRARDDYGLRNLRVFIRIHGEEIPIAASESDALDRRQLVIRDTIMLENHELTFRDDVQVYAVAEDLKPERGQAAGVSPIHYIDIRPFLQRYRLEEKEGGQGESEQEPPESQALEELVKRQRENLSETFQLSRRDPKQREGRKALAEAEAQLAAQTEQLSGLLEQLPAAPEEITQEAAPQLAKAAASMQAATEQLERDELDDARTSQEEALRSLLQARQNVTQTQTMPQQASQAMAQADQQMLQQMQPRAPEEAERRELADMAREADELARTEASIREQLAQPAQDQPQAQQEQQQEQQAQQQGQQQAQQQGQQRGQEQGQQGEEQGHQQEEQQAQREQQSKEEGQQHVQQSQQEEQQAQQGQEQAQQEGQERTSQDPAREAVGTPQERQAEAVVRAQDLRQRMAENPAATDLARERMGEAEQQMRQAQGALDRDLEEEGGRELTEAQQKLEGVAEHLRALAAATPAEKMEYARDMAEEVAEALTDPDETPPRPSPQNTQPQQSPTQQQSQSAQQSQSQSQQQSQSQSRASSSQGSDREQAAETAETLQDVMADTQRTAEEDDPGLVQRMEDMEERHELERAPRDIRDAQQARQAGDKSKARSLERGTAGRMQQLARDLEEERQRLQHGMLERLSEAEQEASELRGEVATQLRDGVAAVPKSTAEQLEELGEDVSTLGDRELTERSEILLRHMSDAGRKARSATGVTVPEVVVSESLTPMTKRLQVLIQETLKDRLPVDGEERVPDEYRRLVEQYYRALSDDVR